MESDSGGKSKNKKELKRWGKVSFRLGTASKKVQGNQRFEIGDSGKAESKKGPTGTREKMALVSRRKDRGKCTRRTTKQTESIVGCEEKPLA